MFTMSNGAPCCSIPSGTETMIFPPDGLPAVLGAGLGALATLLAQAVLWRGARVAHREQVRDEKRTRLQEDYALLVGAARTLQQVAHYWQQLPVQERATALDDERVWQPVVEAMQGVTARIPALLLEPDTPDLVPLYQEILQAFYTFYGTLEAARLLGIRRQHPTLLSPASLEGAVTIIDRKTEELQQMARGVLEGLEE